MKSPSRALWAVLAGADAASVEAVVTATNTVAEVQAAGGTGKDLSSATQQRRNALDAIVNRGVKALAKWESGAEGKRAEIRGIVDQVSRRGDLADAWIDGTLRELPDDTFGFAAFEERDVSRPPDGDREPSKRPTARGATKTSSRSTPSPTEAARPTATAQRSAAERAERNQQAREARRQVRDAARELTTAERKLETARHARDEADANFRAAEEACAAAQKRHDAAMAELAAAEAD